MITIPITCKEIVWGFKILGLLVLGWLWYAGLAEGSIIAISVASAITLIVLIFVFVFEGDRISKFVTNNVRCECKDD